MSQNSTPHAPWRMSSTCSTSLGKMPHAPSLKGPTLPLTTQRLIREMSGLFDNSGTGEAVFPVSPVDPLKKENNNLVDSLPTTLNAEDLFALLEGAGSTLEVPLVEGVVPNSPPGEDLLIGEGGSQFLEGFTNLSDFLFAGGMTPLEMQPSMFAPLPTVAMATVAEAESTTLVTMPEVVVPKSRKRSATLAKLVMPSTSSANPDHDDYAAKRPRQATATTSKQGGAEIVNEKEKKYRERRDKNNVASRRSREIRKRKFSVMEVKAEELEEANKLLEEQVEELEQLTKTMKAMLVERLTKTM